MSIASKDVILLWQQGDGLWRWSWSRRDEAGEEVESLISNEAFESRSEALESARAAYPDVEILEVDADQHRQPTRPRRRLWPALVAVLAGLLVVRSRRCRCETDRGARGSVR